jgi:hypothetical protein
VGGPGRFGCVKRIVPSRVFLYLRMLIIVYEGFIYDEAPLSMITSMSMFPLTAVGRRTSNIYLTMSSPAHKHLCVYVRFRIAKKYMVFFFIPTIPHTTSPTYHTIYILKFGPCPPLRYRGLSAKRGRRVFPPSVYYFYYYATLLARSKWWSASRSAFSTIRFLFSSLLFLFNIRYEPQFLQLSDRQY